MNFSNILTGFIAVLFYVIGSTGLIEDTIDRFNASNVAKVESVKRLEWTEATSSVCQPKGKNFTYSITLRCEVPGGKFVDFHASIKFDGNNHHLTLFAGNKQFSTGAYVPDAETFNAALKSSAVKYFSVAEIQQISEKVYFGTYAVRM